MQNTTFAYFLRTNWLRDAEMLIRKAEMEGSVLPETDGWVTFTLDDDAYHQKQIIRRNKGTLLFYVFSAEFGWEFCLYHKSKSAAFYKRYDGRFKGGKALDFGVDWALTDKALRAFEDPSEIRAFLKCCLEENQDRQKSYGEEADAFCRAMGLHFCRRISGATLSAIDAYVQGEETYPVLQVTNQFDKITLSNAIETTVIPELVRRGFTRQETGENAHWRYGKTGEFGEGEYRQEATQVIDLHKPGYLKGIYLTGHAASQRVIHQTVEYEDEAKAAEDILKLLAESGFDLLDRRSARYAPASQAVRPEDQRRLYDEHEALNERFISQMRIIEEISPESALIFIQGYVQKNRGVHYSEAPDDFLVLAAFFGTLLERTYNGSATWRLEGEGDAVRCMVGDFEPLDDVHYTWYTNDTDNLKVMLERAEVAGALRQDRIPRLEKPLESTNP